MKVVVELGVTIPMDDGTLLVADVYRPAEGRHPVLVQRTPYGRALIAAGEGILQPVRAAAAGFVVVVQDVRGRGESSGGPFDPYRAEAADGAATLRWAAEHAHGDGTVGVFGVSYMGGAAWQAATAPVAGLGALAAAMAPCDLYDSLHVGGALAWGSVAGWVVATLGPGALVRSAGAAPDLLARVHGLIDDIDDLPVQLLRRPLVDLAPVGPDGSDVVPFLREVLDRPTRDDWWTSTLVGGAHGDVEVPALIVAGWHDFLLRSDLAHFAALTRHGGSEVARVGTRLVIGPWSHGTFGNQIGPIDFGLRANGLSLDLRGDLTELHLRWFGRWLRGEGAGREPRVRIFVQGIDRWRDEEAWPLERAVPTRLHLRAGAVAAFEAPGADEGDDRFRFDPDDPVPTLGGAHMSYGPAPRGPAEVSTLLARPDVVTYTTAPLTEPIEVTGPVTAVLHASTDGPDTDWVVRLCDVHPDGRTLHVCDGIVRARFRLGVEESRLVEPGAVLAYDVDLGATSIVFGVGHRMRVLVTSSDAPRYDTNPNTGEWPAHAVAVRVAEQRLVHDAARPSHVLLPIVPASGS